MVCVFSTIVAKITVCGNKMIYRFWMGKIVSKNPDILFSGGLRFMVSGSKSLYGETLFISEVFRGFR